MPRTRGNAILRCALSSVVLVPAVSGFVATAPVLEHAGANWGAPCLIQTQTGFYSFATIGSGVHTPFAYSPDFVSWDLVTDSRGHAVDAMPYLPTWVDQSDPGIWAPDVNLLDNGTYVMYFAGKLPNSGPHCLGYAYANAIQGPYIPNNSTWFCPGSNGNGDQSIDPDGFRDPVTGKRYVTFKWNQASQTSRSETKRAAIAGCGPQQPPWHPTPIMIQEVDQDGVTKIGNMTQLVDNDGDSDCGNTESPTMMRDALGRYVLYFSTGFFQAATYTVSYAVSTTSVYGPYTRASDPFLATGVYNMRGPGVADVLNDGLFMVLFAQNLDQPDDDNRLMRTALVNVATNNTVLGNGTLPSSSSSSGSSSSSTTQLSGMSTSASKTVGTSATAQATTGSGSTASATASGAGQASDGQRAGAWTTLIGVAALSMAIMLVS